MFKLKGWVPRLNRMSHKELIAELRRMQRTRGHVLEREAKIATIEKLLQRQIVPMGFNPRPGGITIVTQKWGY